MLILKNKTFWVVCVGLIMFVTRGLSTDSTLKNKTNVTMNVFNHWTPMFFWPKCFKIVDGKPEPFFAFNTSEMKIAQVSWIKATKQNTSFTEKFNCYYPKGKYLVEIHSSEDSYAEQCYESKIITIEDPNKPMIVDFLKNHRKVSFRDLDLPLGVWFEFRRIVKGKIKEYFVIYDIKLSDPNIENYVILAPGEYLLRSVATSPKKNPNLFYKLRVTENDTVLKKINNSLANPTQVKFPK